MRKPMVNRNCVNDPETMKLVEEFANLVVKAYEFKRSIFFDMNLNGLKKCQPSGGK